jgi:hypothetical protein
MPPMPLASPMSTGGVLSGQLSCGWVPLGIGDSSETVRGFILTRPAETSQLSFGRRPHRDYGSNHGTARR